MVPMATCPDGAALRRLALGQLSEGEAAPLEEGAQGLGQAAFLPQASEDQVGPDFAHGHRLGFAGRMGV